jgi:hypothetical protein
MHILKQQMDEIKLSSLKTGELIALQKQLVFLDLKLKSCGGTLPALEYHHDKKHFTQDYRDVRILLFILLFPLLT